MTDLEILQSLAGEESAFCQALRELGWFKYVIDPFPVDYSGNAKSNLNPMLRGYGAIEAANAHIYRMILPNTATWHDALAVAQSHLRAEPQFAVFFCTLQDTLLLIVPTDPKKAANKQKNLTASCATIKTSQSSSCDVQTVQKLKNAPKDNFRKLLQDLTAIEKVTKKFYELFKEQHTDFLKTISGIDDQGDREWYASLMLNRLMFLYFIQEKQFLEGDARYLFNRLASFSSSHKPDSFYRDFLLPLFHDGLGARERTPELLNLLGDVPYMNGGFFALHSLESKYTEIQIPDVAFGKVFAFFNEWNWSLDDRPARVSGEINPDVLGYIFEKYINQKQMGAYYTKEDITEYIGRNTILPYLLDKAMTNYSVRTIDLKTGKPDSAKLENHQAFMASLLHKDPDRYIYPPMLQGMDLPLPEEIKAGITSVSARGGWNAAASEEYALATETWREVVERRQRCEEVRKKLRVESLESREQNTDSSLSTSDSGLSTLLVTLNLNIPQFVEDVVRKAEDPAYIAAFWDALSNVRILDPTCGSGAFLFAALNLLKPLYEACIERMAQFPGNPHFRKALADAAAHPNHSYFIYKSIILNNLYGVDLMEEAVEICKLRLFLKLAAQAPDRDHMEPLPDMDFNIRAGNTLVGYATREQLSKAMRWDQNTQGKMVFGDEEDELNKVEKEATKISDLYARYSAMQLEAAMPVEKQTAAITKRDLTSKLASLSEQLNALLSREYGIQPGFKKKYAEWKHSHRPFHWFTEFYGVMAHGGFDVIIGNPPWKEYAATKKEYTVKGYLSETCGNLYAFCIERSLLIRSNSGLISFIVQLPITSSNRMAILREMLRKEETLHVISFDDRPSRLFEGLEHSRSAIVISKGADCLCNVDVYTTRYQRWASIERNSLFMNMHYIINSSEGIHESQFPKCANVLQDRVFSKISRIARMTIQDYICDNATPYYIFYQESTQYWIKSVYGVPYYSKNDNVGAPAHGRYIYFNTEQYTRAICALFNSSLFYLYFIAYGDCFHLSQALACSFPITDTIVNDITLANTNLSLMTNLIKTAERKTINTKIGDDITYDEFYPRFSKPIIDEIDRVLAKHYGFTEEELDFIINYDIKYRMGKDSGEEEAIK